MFALIFMQGFNYTATKYCVVLKNRIPQEKMPFYIPIYLNLILLNSYSLTMVM